jgi:hypothetical protein
MKPDPAARLALIALLAVALFLLMGVIEAFAVDRQALRDKALTEVRKQELERRLESVNAPTRAPSP